MTYNELYQQIVLKKSFLCVGLDTDLEKIPSHLKNLPDPAFEFNRRIIDATKDYCVAYKINTAFYESRGAEGWQTMRQTIEYIPKDVFIIADAKRGDIGNTTDQYAKAFFETLPCDAITVAPYMGADSVTPFLKYQNKWGIVLALTSNKTAEDFQLLEINGTPLYKKVLETSKSWGSKENMMYVVGATRPEMLNEIRKIIPDHFLLVPGVGAQGGSLEEVAKYGMNKQCGLLVNSSRGIIYASDKEDFAEKAATESRNIQQQMEKLLLNIK